MGFLLQSADTGEMGCAGAKEVDLFGGFWLARPPAAGFSSADRYDGLQSKLPKSPKFEFRSAKGEKLPAGCTDLTGRLYGQDPASHGSMVDTGAVWTFTRSQSKVSITWAKDTCDDGPTHEAWRAQWEAEAASPERVHYSLFRPVNCEATLSGTPDALEGVTLAWGPKDTFGFFDNGGSSKPGDLGGWKKYDEEE